VSSGVAVQSFIVNSTTSPGAFAPLAIFTGGSALLAGATYELIMACYLAGTTPVDGTDNDNVQLVVDSTVVGRLLMPATAGLVATAKFIAAAGSGGVVQMQSRGAGTTGTIYRTMLVANPMAAQIL
jgi:hypothetical protein